MRSLPMAVTAELSMNLLLDGDRTVEVPCSMEYRADEPYAIHATFRTGPADIEWVFARDLVVEGLQRFSGEGDIVIRPVHARIPLVEIALNSPTGRAELYVERSALEHFLRRTYDIVPVGTESSEIDMDDVIREILDSTPMPPVSGRMPRPTRSPQRKPAEEPTTAHDWIDPTLDRDPEH